MMCPSFPGYSVDDEGRVFSHRKRFGLGKGRGGGVRIDESYSKELRMWLGHGNYPYVSISVDGKQRAIPIHVLIADAKLGPRPKGEEVRHLDGNSLNLQADNLAYGSRADNSDDKVRHGRQPKGETHGKSILNESQILDIRSKHRDGGVGVSELARGFGVSRGCIYGIIAYRTWRHVL